MDKPARVTVVDFDMHFGTMVVFMIKWAIAVIPAACILGLLIFGTTMFFTILGTAIAGAAG